MERYLVKEIIEKVNEVLKADFERPVIDKGYRKYDEVNGRKLNTVYGVKDLINNFLQPTGIRACHDSGREISLVGGELTFKTKSKKSDMISSWDFANQLTIVSIYVENENLLEQDITEIVEKAKIRRENQIEERKQKEEESFKKFLDLLKEKNISFQEFQKMFSMYKELTFEQQSKLKAYSALLPN